MNFIIILLALGVEFALHLPLSASRDRWCHDWADWLVARCGVQRWWQGWPAVVLLVGLPLGLTQVVFFILSDISALLAWTASLVVLLLMLGPEDLLASTERYRERVDQSDAVLPAFTIAAAEIEVPLVSDDDAFERSRRHLAGLALSAERAWVLPLFWFFVLGPVGAIAARLVSSLERGHEFDPKVQHALGQLNELLRYLPSRIAAIAMGVVGTLPPVLHTLSELGWWRWGQSAAVIAMAALAALDQGRINQVITLNPAIYRLHAMLQLLQRSLVVWLLLFALITLSLR